jgi:formylglycine-generating enzyme required for sulfatase activity
VPINSLENISAYQGKHSMLAKNLKRYAWDNETGELIYDVKPFKASKYLVSNGEFYRFMEDNGYHQ